MYRRWKPTSAAPDAPGTESAAQSARLARHAPFLVLLLMAAALRAVVTVGFQPILWYLGDSISYLQYAVGGAPVPFRPAGYSFFLLAVEPLHSLAAVAVIQHVVGLGIGVVVYALCLRLGLARWIATLAAVPPLFDAWEITTEQYLLSETIFTALLVAAFALALWSPAARRPRLWMAPLGGFLIGVAADVRTLGLFLIVPLLLLLVMRRAGVARVVLTVALFAVPVLAYAGYFDSHFGWFGLSASGRFSYGRVAPFASCAGVSLTAEEQRLCPTPAQQRLGQAFFWWGADSPYNRLPGSVHQRDSAAQSFAIKIIEHQPLDYAHAVWDDLTRTFSPGRNPSVYDARSEYPALPQLARTYATRYQGPATAQGRPNEAIEQWFAGYQRVAYVPGIVYLLALVITAAAALLGRSVPRGLRSAALSLGLAGLLLLVIPPVLETFDYRFLVPALPILSVTAAISASLLGTRLASYRRAA